MNPRLKEFAKTFGDLVIDFVQSQNVEDIEEFLDFLGVHEATVRNARQAAEDRVQKLKIVERWDSPN